jgi:uncharacterized protein (DUF2267 family)
MSRTGVPSLDHSIDKTNTWLAEIDAGFGSTDRRLAYRVLRAWLHTLRDRITVEVAGNFAAQLPELLRGVFYDGWNPARVPVKFDREEYIARFARDARVHLDEVGTVAALVTTVVRRHMSEGVVDEAISLLPPPIRELLRPPAEARP